VLLDLTMPGISGLTMLESILAVDPGLEVILMTAQYSEEAAVEAIQRAHATTSASPLTSKNFAIASPNCFGKPKNASYLSIRSGTTQCLPIRGIVARSPLMLDVFAKIRRVAPHFRTVLVTGATGTGKELVSRALHHLSPVAANPFVVCNCSAIVESLLESELFVMSRARLPAPPRTRLVFLSMPTTELCFSMKLASCR